MNARSYFAGLIFSASSLISVAAFACPQLAGQYKCDEEDGTSFTMKLSQTANGNVEVFRIDNGQKMIADNQAHPFQYSDSLKDATLRAWCDDDKTLHTQTLGHQYSGGALFGDLVSNEDYSLDGKNLHLVASGKLTSSDGEYPIKGQQSCTLVP